MGPHPVCSLLRDVFHMVAWNGCSAAGSAPVCEPAWRDAVLRYPDHGLERDCASRVVTADGLPYGPARSQAPRIARELHPGRDLPLSVLCPELLAVLCPRVRRGHRRGHVVDEFFGG